MNDDVASDEGPLLAVIVPCHNPRQHYLQRVLDALRAQSLPVEEWALVVVDNASDRPLEEWVDVSWHPQGRIVREETLGLTPARLRGISETRGDVLVFVDDDNVLAADYLAQAVTLARAKPFLGAFGGVVTPEYEPSQTAVKCPRPGMLGIRDVPVSVWSNDINHWPSTPIGAGLCLRREVALAYREECRRNPIRQALDRRGSSLVSGGDMDIVYTGLALGLGMGVFRSLKATHLIPPQRLQPDYLLRLSEAIGYSAVILDALWNRAGYTEACFPDGLTLCRRAISFLTGQLRQRRYVAARRRGAARGRKRLSELSAGDPCGITLNPSASSTS